MRKLKVKPQLIYPKDVGDKLFLYSEGGRNVGSYGCSHTFKYGNPISQEILTIKEESGDPHFHITVSEETEAQREYRLKENMRQQARVKAEMTLKTQSKSLEKMQEISGHRIFDIIHTKKIIEKEEVKLFQEAVKLQ
jgi:hypothetical protein